MSFFYIDTDKLISRLVASKRYLLLTVFAIAIMLISGCVETDVRIKVNPNGSGVITETFKMNKDLIKINGKSLAAKSTPMSATQISERIKAYGGQVRVVSNEGIITEKSFGYKVAFEFDDINKFIFVMKQQTGKDLSYSFKLTQGDSSVLQVKSDFDLFEEAEKKLTSEQRKFQEELVNDLKFKELIKKIYEQLTGTRLSICLDFGERVLHSNAMYQHGSVIDLFSVDFNQIKPSKQDFEKLMSAQSSGKLTKDEFMKMRLPGLRVELQKDIQIKF